MRLVYGACGCHKGQKARAPVTCMLRVCTYSCAVIDCVIWDFVFKFRSKVMLLLLSVMLRLSGQLKITKHPLQTLSGWTEQEQPNDRTMRKHDEIEAVVSLAVS